MLVYAELQLETDVPYWFTRETFYSRFDQADFVNHRAVKDVEDIYLRDWFRYSAAGIPECFRIPVVSAVGARTDLIGTRHRLAVLVRHLEELPIAIATAWLDDEDQRFLDSIAKRPLDRTQPFRIPDLPIRSEL